MSQIEKRAIIIYWKRGFFGLIPISISHYFTLNIYFATLILMNWWNIFRKNINEPFSSGFLFEYLIASNCREYLQMLLPQTSRNRRAVHFPRRHCPLCWVWEGNCWTMEGRKRWSHLQDATTNLRSLRSPRTKQQRVSCWHWLTASLKTDSWVFGLIFKLNYKYQTKW